MKQIITNTIAILDRAERRKWTALILMDIVMSVLDIVFLALLLFIIQTYTGPAHESRFAFLLSWLPDHSSVLLLVFFFFSALRILPGS